MATTGTQYYYLCGTHTSGEVHCNKSSTGFKQFADMPNYSKIIQLACSKKSMDKKFAANDIHLAPGTGLMTSLANVLTMCANLESGEDRILTAELKTKNYMVFDADATSTK